MQYILMIKIEKKNDEIIKVSIIMIDWLKVWRNSLLYVVNSYTNQTFVLKSKIQFCLTDI